MPTDNMMVDTGTGTLRDVWSGAPGSTIWRRVLPLRSLPATVVGVTFQDCLFGPGSATLDESTELAGVIGLALERESRDPSDQLRRACLAHPRLDLLEAVDVRFEGCRFIGGGFTRTLLFVARDRLEAVINGLVGGTVPTSLLDPRLPRAGGAPMPPPLGPRPQPDPAPSQAPSSGAQFNDTQATLTGGTT